MTEPAKQTSPTDAYNEGVAARTAGTAPERCPYTGGRQPHHGPRARWEAYKRDCWFAGYHNEPMPAPYVDQGDPATDPDAQPATDPDAQQAS